MKQWAITLLALLLAACARGGEGQGAGNGATAPDLETAAIAAGVIPDPANSDITGLYARDTDRLCVVPAALGFRIGAFVDYGPRQFCSGSGTATRAGEVLRVKFDNVDGCEFDARYEGDRIVFPGKLPAACDKLCVGRASLAALDAALLGNAVAEASAMRDGTGRLLCATP